MDDFAPSFCAVCESEHNRDSLYCSRRCQKLELLEVATPSSSHSLAMLATGNSSSSSLSYFPPQPAGIAVAAGVASGAGTAAQLRGSPSRSHSQVHLPGHSTAATQTPAPQLQQRKSFDRNRPLPPKRASLSTSLPKSIDLVMPLAMTPLRADVGASNGQSGAYCNGNGNGNVNANGTGAGAGAGAGGGGGGGGGGGIGVAKSDGARSPIAMRRSQSASSSKSITTTQPPAAIASTAGDLPPLSTLKYPVKPAGSRFDYNGATSLANGATGSSLSEGTAGGDSKVATDVDAATAKRENGHARDGQVEKTINRPLRKMFFFKAVQSPPPD